MKLLNDDEIKFIKEKWVPALRSGNYKQGRGYLLRDYYYCCLGVGCMLEGIEPEALEGFSIPDNSWGTHTYKIYNKLYMLDEDGLTDSLINMNDVEEKNFNQIADYLERACEFEE